ncbi:MAG: hypothetical protein ACLGGV_09575 [Bacteroidia bacterium]
MMKNILITVVTAIITTVIVCHLTCYFCGSCKGDSCHKPNTECTKGKEGCKKGHSSCKKDCKKACCKKADADSTATETVEMDSTAVAA